MTVSVFSPTSRKAETGGSLSFTSQPAQATELQASERLFPKWELSGNLGVTPDCDLWSTNANRYIFLETNTNMCMHIQKIKDLKENQSAKRPWRRSLQGNSHSFIVYLYILTYLHLSLCKFHHIQVNDLHFCDQWTVNTFLSLIYSSSIWVIIYFSFIGVPKHIQCHSLLIHDAFSFILNTTVMNTAWHLMLS